MTPPQLTFTVSVVALVVSLLSAIAGLGRWLVTYRQINVQNLLQLSQYLHQSEYREARQAVRITPKDQLDFEPVRKVLSSFDFAALFVRHKLVEESVFMEYWGQFLQFLGGHLSEISDNAMFGGLTVRQYYRHCFWLIERAAKHSSSTRPLSRPGRSRKLPK